MTDRARFFDYAVTKNGSTVEIIPHAEITLYVAESDPPDPLLDTIYDVDGVEIIQPWITDEFGTIEFYLDNPKRVMIKYHDLIGGGTVFVDNEAVLPDPAMIVYSGSNTLVELEAGITVISADGPLIDAQDNYVMFGDDVVYIDTFARRVGIDTVNPESILHIIGDLRVEDELANKFIADELGFRWVDASDVALFEVNSNGVSTDLTPDVTDTLFLGSSTKRWITLYCLAVAAGRGAVTAPCYTSYLETTSGMSFPSAGVVAWSVLTNEIFRIDADELRTQVSLSMLELGSLPTPGTNLAIMAPRNDGRWYNQHNGGSPKFFIESDQLTTLNADGTTNNPTISALLTYEDLAEMVLTFTNCKAGDILDIDFTGTFKHAFATAAIVIALKHNSNAESYDIALSFPVVNEVKLFSTGGIFIATAGTNTIKVRWLTDNITTATANGANRHLKGVRRPV